MRGYLNAPEATAAAIDTDGWLHTGDLGSMDDHGYLRIAGRLKEMIIRGGENIYPREIEEVLIAHPAVADASVLGVPDAYYGEVVGAAIRPAGPREGPGPLADHRLVPDDRFRQGPQGRAARPARRGSRGSLAWRLEARVAGREGRLRSG